MTDAAYDLFALTAPRWDTSWGASAHAPPPATLDDLARIVGAGLVRTALHGADRGLFD
ncbi:hypothetical protein [Microbacterium testaceum]|uniref:hypothetical protein n=1 Tax=Microbacterium testaceum TaxID=2033 RepID=UPI002AC3EBFE|nr:hypothetical protein [Microbacterium testaceum]MDZ5146375.1 hypothetical protein [Microbacterium testaceum]